MIQYCCLDMDGVIVDCIRGLLEVHGVKTPVKEFYRDHLGKDDVQIIMGIPIEEFWAPVDENFWANLEWMEDGREIFRMVEDMFGRDNIVIATTPSPNHGCWDGKRRWIKKHLPKHYHQVEHQMFGARKWMMANHETILVDDFDSNIKKFAATRGGHVCHVPRLWNSLYTMADFAHKVVETTLQSSK